MTSVLEKLEPGVNGAILVESRSGRHGYVFEATDGSKGPFRPITGPQDVRAFMQAKADWRAWLTKNRQVARTGA